MGFNRSSFNRTAFNRPSGAKAILAKANGFETVNCSIGSALNFNGSATGYERLNAVLIGNSGWIKSVIGTETVDELVATGDMYVLTKVAGAETVKRDIAIAADVFPVVSGNEIISENCTLGANIIVNTTGAETINAATSLGANIISSLTEGYEFVDESASLENIDIKTCYLNVSLRPNQILVIDANTYNVLLDNQNAIDIQSGDWIDELNRNTVDIKIEAASGSANLDATILYTERFL